MRVLVLLLASFLAAPAMAGPAPVQAGYEIDAPGRDCLDCAGASVWVAQTEPKNCYDCGGIGVAAGVSNDDEGTHVDASVCRGGFVYFCIVDIHRTV